MRFRSIASAQFLARSRHRCGADHHHDAVLRVGELLIPVIGVMKRDLLTGGYIQLTRRT